MYENSYLAHFFVTIIGLGTGRTRIARAAVLAIRERSIYRPSIGAALKTNSAIDRKRLHIRIRTHTRTHTYAHERDESKSKFEQRNACMYKRIY